MIHDHGRRHRQSGRPLTRFALTDLDLLHNQILNGKILEIGILLEALVCLLISHTKPVTV
jgi:hypothetical protein